MPPRTLASLAHALSAAPDLDAALVALGEALAELDRGATIALLRYDGRREMIRERMTPQGGRVNRTPLETSLDHLPGHVRVPVLGGGQFVEMGERSQDYAQLFAFKPLSDSGMLSLRGLRVEGYLVGVLALFEPKKIFGTRASERLAPAVALFDLAYARLWEREAREEAVRTLEDVTQRVHADYLRKLTALEAQLSQAQRTPPMGTDAITHAASRTADAGRTVATERAAAAEAEAVRRATRKTEIVEQQLAAAVGQLEHAHIELHRRSESLRQKTRTLYLIDRVLSLDAAAQDPRQLVDGLLSLVGDDMQAQRCSLMLRAPEPGMLYLAAARGIAPHVTEGYRMPVGSGVAGRVAESREPLLVQDVRDAGAHPLLRDQYFTTGSFISFPLAYHGELVGVVNLTNRAQRGVFAEEDVERVRILGLVISLIATQAQLPERLIDSIAVP
jgi:hypothetical protein